MSSLLASHLAQLLSSLPLLSGATGLLSGLWGGGPTLARELLLTAASFVEGAGGLLSAASLVDGASGLLSAATVVDGACGSLASTSAVDGAHGLLAVAEKEVPRLFGVKLLNGDDFAKLLFRFLLNAFTTGVVVFGFYGRRGRRGDYAFTFLALSSTVFLLCFLLESVKLELGFALGLFAVFGILRYRTDAIPIKEMTYLFLLIGVALMNSLSNRKVSYAELFFANGALLLVLGLLESTWFHRGGAVLPVQYDRVELLPEVRRQELHADLGERLGVSVLRVEVKQVSYLRDSAELIVHYRPREDRS